VSIEHTIYAPYSQGGIGIWGWTTVGVFATIAAIMVCVLLSQGSRPGALRKYTYWRQWAVPIAIILLIAYGIWGAFPDPRFRLSKLRGLTPAQVVARLGPPTDERHVPPPGSSENESLLIYDYASGYRLGGFSYGVIFGKDGRVRYVLVGSK
jgi:hypothetical protein